MHHRFPNMQRATAAGAGPHKNRATKTADMTVAVAAGANTLTKLEVDRARPPVSAHLVAETDPGIQWERLRWPEPY